MITLDQFKEQNINIKDALIGNAALEFIAENTTLKVDLNDAKTLEALPFTAKVFITKYCEVVSPSSAVASESIEGLSLSFRSGDKSDMIWDLANALLGDYLKGRVTFVAATSKWR